MERKELTKLIIALVLIGTMILGSFALGLAGPQNQQGSIELEKKQDSGAVEFLGVLKGYEPYLIISNLPENQTQIIKKHERVEGVLSAQGGYIVSIKKAEDISSVYDYLKQNNINSTSMAIIGFPAFVELKLPDGRVLYPSVYEGASIKYPLEPYFKIGSGIKIRMSATSTDGILTNYNPQTITLVPEIVNATFEGNVMKLASTDYRFSILWENRNDETIQELLKNYPEARYYKKNFIEFVLPLTANETIEKKKLEYILFINERSAEINSSFLDKNKVLQDFAGHEVIFPNSTIEAANVNISDLNYPYSVSYAYEIMPIADNLNFTLPKTALKIPSENKLKENATININATIRIIGGRAIMVDNLKISQ